MWLLAFLSVLFLMSLYLFVMAYGLCYELLHPKRRKLSYEPPGNGISFSCRTTDGCTLQAEFFEAARNMGRAVILVHDAGCSGASLGRIGRWFLSRGYHVFWYDQRGSGKSARKPVTLGYRERKDLRMLVTMARQLLGEECRIGTYGVGTGAVTALLHACIDDRISFVIADSAWSDLEELLKQRLSEKGYPAFPILQAADCLCRLSAGFSIRQVSPKRELRRRSGLVAIPALFIAREDDRKIPAAMSRELYEYKQGEKALYICPEEDPVQYEAQIGEFLRESTEEKSAVV